MQAGTLKSVLLSCFIYSVFFLLMGHLTTVNRHCKSIATSIQCIRYRQFNSIRYTEKLYFNDSWSFMDYIGMFMDYAILSLHIYSGKFKNQCKIPCWRMDYTLDLCMLYPSSYLRWEALYL